ncbi:hypothetical protein [Hymenobacter rigui]|uniref:Uncharacterized protein n=1 Tax=Hymenobacter rigui TaxID=334424 RepID=A0A3R9MU34_9BACT|nr:hypothetical protein [Hymenobacter rigui]RSK50135.1 hypothetical protein EI291_05640 [Hymenobacter rigui]
MLWLLLTHPLAWLLTYLHPRIWVKLDVRRFVQAGAVDTLLRTFHRQRATVRGIVMVLIAGLASLPTWGHWLPFGLSMAGLLILQAAYWLYDFNPRLNEARNLPYVGRYHVSWNPQAAYFPDRYVWRRAWEQVRAPDETAPPAYEDRQVVNVAGPLLKQLLQNLLVNGCVAYSLTLFGIGVWAWLS